jgi:hypothetical protein
MDATKPRRIQQLLSGDATSVVSSLCRWVHHLRHAASVPTQSNASTSTCWCDRSVTHLRKLVLHTQTIMFKQ